MSIDEQVSDPIHELHGHFDQAARVGLAGMMQWAYVRGQQVQRRLADEVRNEKQKDAATALRQKTNRSMAEALWTRANRSEWWDQASPEQIARVYEAAMAYAPSEPKAADALVAIDRELDRRYAIGVDKETGITTALRGKHLDQAAVEAAQESLTEERKDLEERWRAGLGPEAAERVMDSPGWVGLEARLSQMESAGIDSAAALGAAVEARSLAGSLDVARVLSHRLDLAGLSDGGAGVEAEGPELARLINESLKGNRKRAASKAGKDHDHEPWMVTDRDRGPGKNGPGQGPGRDQGGTRGGSS